MDNKNERGFHNANIQDTENMDVENMATNMLLLSGDKKKCDAYLNARATRDKFINAICKNMDDINNIIDKQCDLDTKIALLDVCIEMLQNVQSLQVVSFHVGFMSDLALSGHDITNTNKE